MKEQSHKDEMSKALRGDFERLRGRGVSTTLAPQDEPAAEPTETEPFAPEPVPLDADDAPAPVTDAEAETAEGDARPGWLDRLLGR